MSKPLKLNNMYFTNKEIEELQDNVIVYNALNDRKKQVLNFVKENRGVRMYLDTEIMAIKNQLMKTYTYQIDKDYVLPKENIKYCGNCRFSLDCIHRDETKCFEDNNLIDQFQPQNKN